MNNKGILRVQVGLTGFYPSMVYTELVYNSGNKNVLINDWYACLQKSNLQSILTYYLKIEFQCLQIDIA